MGLTNLIFATVIFILSIGFSESVEKCVFNLPMNIRTCFSRTEPSLSRNCTELSHYKTCQKTFKVTEIKMEPYSNVIFPKILHRMMRPCCGNCYKMKNYTSFSSMETFGVTVRNSNITNSHFIYPIVNNDERTEKFGYKFIPILSVKTVVYFTPSLDTGASARALLKAAYDLWPMLLVILLMAFIAGFIEWVLDTRANEEEFPRPFFSGVSSGFWWSFVSMTTVGYGDKSPKSIGSRLFAVLWIVIGITISSMFTASLTSAITSASNPPIHDEMRMKVGILRERVIDFTHVIRAGGIPIEFDTVEKMKTAVGDKKIHGFLLDSHTARFYRPETSFVGFDQTTKNFKGGHTSYGILVTHQSDFDFFSPFISDNKLLLEDCLSGSAAVLENEESIALFSPKSGLFIPSVLSCFGMILCIAVFGVVYECIRKRNSSKTSTTEIAVVGRNKKSLEQQMMDDMDALLIKWKKGKEEVGFKL